MRFGTSTALIDERAVLVSVLVHLGNRVVARLIHRGDVGRSKLEDVRVGPVAALVDARAVAVARRAGPRLLINGRDRVGPALVDRRVVVLAEWGRRGAGIDRKSVVEGKSVSVRVGIGGRGVIK